MNNLKEISKKEFYDYINPRDIIVKCIKSNGFGAE